MIDGYKTRTYTHLLLGSLNDHRCQMAPSAFVLIFLFFSRYSKLTTKKAIMQLNSKCYQNSNERLSVKARKQRTAHFGGRRLVNSDTETEENIRGEIEVNR